MTRSDDQFYRQFEETFRGSQAEIRSRLAVYEPFLAPLAAKGDARALDLGCGRGEFLALLGDLGFHAQGVDLDEGMLAAARARGFDVTLEDALEHLRGRPDNSLAVVSGFHIAEHLPFDVLRAIIDEALRALAPGGLLIFETPNPENLNVGAHTFHLDPTHNKPLPPALLKFVVLYAGAQRAMEFRLQHDPRLTKAQDLTIRDLIFGVSPDYAVIAQKGGDAALEASLTPCFERPHGVSLADLVERRARIEGRETAEIEALRARTEGLAARLAAQEQDLADLLQRLEERAAQAETLLAATRASTSWRVTAPLRAVMTATHDGRRKALELALRPARRALERALGAIRRRPALKRPIWRLAGLVPGAQAKLERFIAVRAVAPGDDVAAAQPRLETPPVSLRSRATLGALLGEKAR